MKSKSFLVTVYYEEAEGQNEFVLDTNEALADEGIYEYDLCITRAISDHVVVANYGNDIRVVDVGLTKDPEYIIQLVKENKNA
jgi:hypothetical protein